MPLTDRQLKSLAKSTPTKAFKMHDSAGLFVQVTAGGKVHFRFKYRYRGKDDAASKEKLIAVGTYPDMTLSEARDQRDAFRRQLKDGIDPSKQRHDLREANRQAETFQEAAEVYLGSPEVAGLRPTTISDLKRRARQLEETTIANQHVSAIAPDDITKVLSKIPEPEKRRRLALLIRTVIGDAIRRDGAPRINPASTLPRFKRHQPEHVPAIIDPKPFAQMLRTIDAMSGSPHVRIGLLLLAYLAPRPSELRLSRWSEWDLDSGVWRIPRVRTKMDRGREVFLAPSVVKLLRQLKKHSTGDVLFPSPRVGKILSDNAWNAGLKALAIADHSPHGFRGSFASMTSESREFGADVIKLVLGHQRDEPSELAYLRNPLDAERKRLMFWWAQRVDGMRG